MPDKHDDRRQTPRHPVKAIGALTSGGLTRDVAVRDVSPGGVRVEVGPREVPTGTKIYLRLPRYGLRHAKVVWAHDGSIGVQFAEPLPQRRSYPPTEHAA